MEVLAPKISIIVPIYKVEQYLPKCIESILNQTYTNFELILIDDGSPDNSGKICDVYAKKDNRIIVLHKVNGGVSSARNLGLEKATGAWISFIDSDDWIEKDAYFEIINSIQDKSVDLVIWGIKLVYKNFIKELIVPKQGFFNKKEDINELLIRCDITDLLEGSCNKLYSSKLINELKLKYDTNISYLEDMYFNLKYLQKTKSIIGLANSYYNYRKDYENVSLSRSYPNNFLSIIKESVDMRRIYFLSYAGLYRNEYNLSLDRKVQNAYISLNLEMYNKDVKAHIRRENWKIFLNEGKIEVFKGSYIYFLLSINNPYIIDTVLRLRYLISSYIPGFFNLLSKAKTP